MYVTLSSLSLTCPRNGFWRWVISFVAEWLTSIAGSTWFSCRSQLTPCSDGAGEVVAIGPGVTKWKEGDRIAGQFTLSLQAGPFDDDAHMATTMGGGCDGMLTQYTG